MNVMERFVFPVHSKLLVLKWCQVQSASVFKRRISFCSFFFFPDTICPFLHRLHTGKNLFMHTFFLSLLISLLFVCPNEITNLCKNVHTKKGIEKPRTMMSSRRQWMQSGKKKLWKRTRAHWKRFCFSAYLAHFCHRLTFGHFGPLGNSVVVGRCCMQN